jgi:hypothetical protein
MPLSQINLTDYIGDSLVTINNNTYSLDRQLNTLATNIVQLSAAFSTRVIGITSIDNCVPFAGFFTESYLITTPQNQLALAYLYPSGNPVIRKLNRANYNCDVNGNLINDVSTGYYTLNNDGTITVPKGIYDINAGASAMVCDSHTANLIYNDSTGSSGILLYGSAEYNSSTIFYSGGSSDVKIRGRIVLTADTTNIGIKHYFATFNKGYIGKSFEKIYSDDLDIKTTDLVGTKSHWAYINIQKIKSL